MKENTNCLKGIACPDCGSNDQFIITPRCSATVTDEGVFDAHTFEWDDNTHIFCPNCEHQGKVAEFKPQPYRYTIKVECREVQANGWVETGNWWSAMFHDPEGQPDGVKGCPAGRSQVCAKDAVRDLIERTNAESHLSLQVGDFNVEGDN